MDRAVLFICAAMMILAVIREVTAANCVTHADCNGQGDCPATTAPCMCVEGYTGDFCETAQVCTVAGNECGSHGACDTSSSTYVCTCFDGYTGAVCEIVYCPPNWAETCAICKTTYGTAGARVKCAALKTYLTCMEGSGKGDTGCPLPAADAKTIEDDFIAGSCNALFTDTCISQKDFWKTDQSTAKETDTCSAIQTYFTYLKGKTDLACDGSTTATALATGVETRMKGLNDPTCGKLLKPRL